MENLKEKILECFAHACLDIKDMYVHCKNIYAQSNAQGMPQIGSLPHMPSFFTIDDIYSGLKQFAICNAGDLQGIKATMLNWIGEETHGWICEIFNLALEHGMPHDLELELD